MVRAALCSGGTMISAELIAAIESRGFSIDDCPIEAIQPNWEQFPIVRAIRAAEKQTGQQYNPELNTDYERRVRELEAEGMTRSDAQAVADAQDLMP